MDVMHKACDNSRYLAKAMLEVMRDLGLIKEANINATTVDVIAIRLDNWMGVNAPTLDWPLLGHPSDPGHPAGKLAAPKQEQVTLAK